jgi:hypothetical protein
MELSGQKKGRLVSVRDLPTSPPCFYTPPTTLATKTTGETPDSPSKPTFTRQLMEHKLHTLKMRYKRITQRRVKLMRAIRKTHRQKLQLEDPYIVTTQPQLTITTKRNKTHSQAKIELSQDHTWNFRSAGQRPVPWKLTPVDQHTFRKISDNVQLWTITTTTEKQAPPNPEPRLDPSQASSTEEHKPKRNETKTMDPEHHQGNNSDEYDSPSDDRSLHFKAHMQHPPEIGESNAESAERTKRIKEEVANMKQQRQWRRETQRTRTLQTRITPTDPLWKKKVCLVFPVRFSAQ